jgi:hypothetical protein
VRGLVETIARKQQLPLLVRGANNGAADRPNLIGSAKLDNPTADRWLNPAAFANPPQFNLGNTPRTLPDVRGPGFLSIDGSVARNFILTERLRLQFRAEALNAFNRVNLNQPDVGFLSSTFGRIIAAGEPRRMQFGLKLLFEIEKKNVPRPEVRTLLGSSNKTWRGLPARAWFARKNWLFCQVNQGAGWQPTPPSPKCPDLSSSTVFFNVKRILQRLVSATLAGLDAWRDR